MGKSKKKLALKPQDPEFDLLSDAVARIVKPPNPYAFAMILMKPGYQPELIMFALWRFRERLKSKDAPPVKSSIRYLFDILKNRPIIASYSEGGDNYVWREHYTVQDWHDLMFRGMVWPELARKPKKGDNDFTKLGDIHG